MFFHFQKYNHKQTGCVDGLSINRGEELWWSTLIIGAHNTKKLRNCCNYILGKISLLIIPSMSNFPWSITRHPRQIQFHKTSQIYTIAGLTGLRRHNGAKQHQKKTYWYSTQTCTKSQVKLTYLILVTTGGSVLFFPAGLPSDINYAKKKLNTTTKNRICQSKYQVCKRKH